MGITGLLPQLKSIIERKHVSKYKGQKVAVDTYSWLHKGTYCCAMELCTGAPTDKYILYCVDRVKMLLHHGVVPVMVFDGANLPSKTGTEQKRKSSREVNLAKGMQFLRSGNRDLANECFQKAVDVTPCMAHKLIKVLRKMDVECIVAPYEADAQLTYLNLIGYVSAIISEDTDMIAFGALTVMFKLDKEGYGDEYRQKILGACVTMNLTGWEAERVTQMCIFAGCDYLKSLGGMGVKRAHSAIFNSSANKAPLDECYVKAIARLKMEGVHVPVDYQENFRKALLTFQYQRVYDPSQKCLVTLKTIPPHLAHEEMPFIGADLPPATAHGVARGYLHPSTHEAWPEDDREERKRGDAQSRAQSAQSSAHVASVEHANETHLASHAHQADTSHQQHATAVPRPSLSSPRRSPRKSPESPQSKHPSRHASSNGTQAGIKQFLNPAKMENAGEGHACVAGGSTIGKRQATVYEYANMVSLDAQKEFKVPRARDASPSEADSLGGMPCQVADTPNKRLKTNSPFAPVARVKSKFFSSDDGDSSMVDSSVVHGDAHGGEQERADEEERANKRFEEEYRAQERMSGALAKFAYKGAGQDGVRRVGGDGPRDRKVAGEVLLERFKSPIRAAGLLEDKPRLSLRRNHNSSRSMAAFNVDAFRFSKNKVSN